MIAISHIPVDKAHKLDKLSKKLTSERNLSNTLLYNMLPKQVADELRSGNTVEPKLYENVTLFFSDVEGFTSICDQVSPWDVVDMMNQLYGVMDYLATYFKLYKVETIGDAYMCCSGLPEPDPYHAENIANFALAVTECVKHIKSPVDNETPLKLRIGIHTGSCTGGVVGTLTPHYCLFGDMVNTTARHESTGVAGKVQCSSVLFGRLTHFSKYGDDKPQYNFKRRGLVDMKGKVDAVYTYWLDSGTIHNEAVGPKQLDALSRDVASMLATKKFQRRRYFRRTGDLREETMSDGGTISTAKSTESDGSAEPSTSNSLTKPDGDDISPDDATLADLGQTKDENNDGLELRFNSHFDSLHGNGSTGPKDVLVDQDGEAFGISEQDKKELDDLVAEHELGDTAPPDDQENGSNELWSTLGKHHLTMSITDLVTEVNGLLSNLLKRCMGGHDVPNIELVVNQLHGYIQRISTLYRKENQFHNFQRACHVATVADYLWGRAERARDRSFDVGVMDWNPWNRFILVFSSLVHGVQHHGVSNEQLEKEDHPTYQIHGKGRKSCQERQAVHHALGILADEFPELYDEIMLACPFNFQHLTRKLIFATDHECQDTLKKRSDFFKRTPSHNDTIDGRHKIKIPIIFFGIFFSRTIEPVQFTVESSNVTIKARSDIRFKCNIH